MVEHQLPKLRVASSSLVSRFQTLLPDLRSSSTQSGQIVWDCGPNVANRGIRFTVTHSSLDLVTAAPGAARGQPATIHLLSVTRRSTVDRYTASRARATAMLAPPQKGLVGAFLVHRGSIL